MLDVEEIKRRLSDRKLTVVAERTGVHKVTLYRLVHGEALPAYDTLQRVSDYLEGTSPGDDVRTAVALAKGGGR